MSKINEIISGPLGSWLNIGLFALVTFFSSQLYADFQDVKKDLRENMLEDMGQHYRITFLEAVSPYKPKPQ